MMATAHVPQCPRGRVVGIVVIIVAVAIAITIIVSIFDPTTSFRRVRVLPVPPGCTFPSADRSPMFDTSTASSSNTVSGIAAASRGGGIQQQQPRFAEEFPFSDSSQGHIQGGLRRARSAPNFGGGQRQRFDGVDVKGRGPAAAPVVDASPNGGGGPGHAGSPSVSTSVGGGSSS